MALRPLNKLNYWKWTLWTRFKNGSKDIHLHLGCGTKQLAGFINIDGNLFRKTNLWLDLCNGLPFADNTVASAYASHVFEHFYPDELDRILNECHRVLRPSGSLRIVVPDMGSAVRAYVEGRSELFIDFPRTCKSTGGRLSNLLFCDGNHRQGFDFSYLEEVLQKARFSDVRQLTAEKSHVYPTPVFMQLREQEAGVADYSLFVECRKNTD